MFKKMQKNKKFILICPVLYILFINLETIMFDHKRKGLLRFATSSNYMLCKKYRIGATRDTKVAV